jgi:hypothetical protein
MNIICVRHSANVLANYFRLSAAGCLSTNQVADAGNSDADTSQRLDLDCLGHRPPDQSAGKTGCSRNHTHVPRPRLRAGAQQDLQKIRLKKKQLKKRKTKTNPFNFAVD